MFLFSIINSSFTDIPCMYVYVFSLIITYMIFYTYIGDVMSTAPFLQKCFPSVYHKEALDKSTNQYCKFDSVTLTMFTSSLYLAALVASFGASWVTKKLGIGKYPCSSVVWFSWPELSSMLLLKILPC